MAKPATLGDVVTELKETNKNEKDTGKGLSKLTTTIGAWMLFTRRRDDMQRLETEEERREARARFQNLVDNSAFDFEGERGLRDVLHGTLLGSFAANFLKNFIAPVAKIAKWFVRGGVITSAAFVLYDLFSDIGENKEFIDTLTRAKEVFSRDVKPAFDKLEKELNELGLVLGDMSLDIGSINEWYHGRFKNSLQQAVIGQLNISVDAISNLFQGGSLLMDGEFAEGVKKLSDSIVATPFRLIDNITTNMLKSLGMNTEYDSALTAFNEKIGAGALEWFENWFWSALDKLSIAHTTIIPTDSIAKTFNRLIDSHSLMFESAMNLKVGESMNDKVDSTIAAFERIYDGFIKGFNEIFNWISSVPDRIINQLKSFVPKKMWPEAWVQANQQHIAKPIVTGKPS